MSDIAKAFIDGKALIGFITGGYPDMQRTEEFILEMVNGGIDMVEIGIPFSDPVAECHVIQEASCRALASGADLDAMFSLVHSLRQKTQVPLVFLTYLNPVFHHGYERFFQRCQEAGLDAVLIPDLPFEEMDEVAEVCRSYDTELISTVAHTSGNRIGMIAARARGFLNVVFPVDDDGGMDESMISTIRRMVESTRTVSEIPLVLSAGFRTTEQMSKCSALADGVVIESAIVELIAEHGNDAGPYIQRYVRGLKDALNYTQRV